MSPYQEVKKALYGFIKFYKLSILRPDGSPDPATPDKYIHIRQPVVSLALMKIIHIYIYIYICAVQAEHAHENGFGRMES